MLVPIDWIREYVDFDLSPEDLAERLTMAGLEVEETVESAGGKVFSTYVTPNRPDLLSVVGVARDVSALLGNPLRPPKPVFAEGEQSACNLAKVEIQSPVNCPRYSARLVMDTKVTESPDWMKERLISAGLRPINNVVDATNFVLIELGQPLHAFDYDLVTDHHIIVRQAKAGEKITTIDGEERELTPEMLVIADPKQAVAIAGVMGGFESEVGWHTGNVLLESANFNRLSIRRTARALGMNTEASYRFERGVDPELTVYALDRVAQLIQETGGGTIARGVVDACPGDFEPVKLKIRPERVELLLGMRIEENLIAEYLRRLGMEVGSPGEVGIPVTVPTFRPDILREEDLIEEVSRIHGYDTIPTTPVIGETMQGKDSPEGEFASRVSSILISAGLEEVVTGSMTAPLEGLPQVSLRNPLSKDLGQLRKHLILDFLSVISYNIKRGIRNIGIFEIGRVFEQQDDSLIVEKLSIGGALTGSSWDQGWNIEGSSLDADFFFCKGIVESLLNRLGVEEVRFEPSMLDLFHPGRAAAIHSTDTQLGIIGEIGPEVARKYDVPERTYAFELDFSELMNLAGGVKIYSPISRYPAVTRDLAVIVDEGVPYQQVRQLLERGAGELMESLKLFDVYTGPPLQPGTKSLAFAIVFRSPGRTLRDEEIDEKLNQTRTLLSAELRASFRDT